MFTAPRVRGVVASVFLYNTAWIRLYSRRGHSPLSRRRQTSEFLLSRSVVKALNCTSSLHVRESTSTRATSIYREIQRIRTTGH